VLIIFKKFLKLNLYLGAIKLMKMQITPKAPLIKCVHCGAEYIPGEIYMPGALIGQPDDIVRDTVGKLLYEDYFSEDREPNPIEHYTCDYCNKPFIVEAIITNKTREEAPEKDFGTQYVSLLD
jgi:hypothetical protein